MIAIVLAALSNFVLGGLWYSPLLFLEPWAKAAGFNDYSADSKKKGHETGVYVAALVFALIAAVCFSALVGPKPPLERALRLGLFAGVGFAATSIGIQYQFADRTWTMFAIDAGYHVVKFLIYGIIFGTVHQ
eukprot:TRINITY_DN31671_c0_g1_i1.p2 TRINITY_DN31671_c0_g1~~TRINITY_DN31671_c0_g1_i1.p2  ORF type:complete len:132 (-),score=37.94 TRINITY_DN31671_c0_g1_i1:160-555(-)